MINLRPYQTEARDAVLSEWAGGHRKTLLVLPTGTGKTVVFSSVIDSKLKEKGGKALILAHRGELLTQAADKLSRVCGLSCALEKAGSTAVGSFFPVTLGSVQTLSNGRRLAEYPSDYFSTVVVDEAHHSMSASYQRILEHFDSADVLGVTATPDRADRKSLGQFYDSLAYEYTLPQAVSDGYLCPVKAQMIPLKLDISHVGISNGDYSAEELGESLDSYLPLIAKEMVSYCKGRKTLVFLPLIETSVKFCGLLKEMGMNAAEVNGQSEDREQILKDFDEGRTDILCNSMLLTEGWDCPSVDCIAVLRPTRIRSLYQQMVGRGMRLCEGKNELLLLDFLWLSEKHDLCKPSSLLSKDEVIAQKIDAMINSGFCAVDLMAAEKQAERNVIEEREAALARELREMRNRQKKLVDPIQYALSLEDEVLLNYVPSFAWEMEPPTEKQILFITNSGISPESIMNKGQAHMIIDRIKRRFDLGLSTPKQIRLLEKYGFVHVGIWKKSDAESMISRLSQNGWRLPYGYNAAAYVPGGLK